MSSSDFSSFMRELQGLQASEANPVESPSPASASSSSTASSSTAKRIKLLLVTTHTNQVNGYAKVAYHLLQELAKQPWLDLVHFGTQRMTNGALGRTLPSTVRVIDGTALEKEKQIGFAFTELPSVIQSERPDVVLLYNDLSVICTYIESIRKAIDKRTFKIWAYLDTTYPFPPSHMMDALNRDVERLFCFTKGWKEHLKEQGATRPIDVLSHAVDPSIYRPLSREIARQTLGLPKDVFLFTSLNKNIPRKRLDLLIIAFTQLIVRHPTKPLFLLIVADKGDRGGFSLFDIFARELKLHQASVDHYGNRLLVTSKDTCYRDEDINLLYNCGDVGVSCADGEGFGLCTFEQMSLGIPQIVPEIQGYTEYCLEENSLRVKPALRHYLAPSQNAVTGEAHVVNPEDVAKAMETYVFQEEIRTLHGKRGKEKVAGYTWEKVTASLVKRLRALTEEEEE
jgi:glycosyltransferase involved in cell wall biosynthesis